jgi:hypothetical protein
MIVDALVRAMDRRDDVFQMLEDSRTRTKQDVGLVSCWVWESWAAGLSLTCRLEDSPETTVRGSLPGQKNLDKSCLMAAEDPCLLVLR